MPKPVVCKSCGKDGHYRYQCFQNRKPIKQKGRRAIEYEIFRDFTARPYLDKTYGRVCALCKRGDVHLDIDHIQKRGSHPELKMVLSNLRYLCRDCHVKIT